MKHLINDQLDVAVKQTSLEAVGIILIFDSEEKKKLVLFQKFIQLKRIS